MREKIKVTDTVQDVLVEMAEGNPGAITVMIALMKKNPIDGLIWVLGLDDMNIRGSQIWIAYKEHCGQDIDSLVECIQKRDPEMIKTVNRLNQMQGCTEKAVERGASFLTERPVFDEEGE